MSLEQKKVSSSFVATAVQLVENGASTAKMPRQSGQKPDEARSEASGVWCVRNVPQTLDLAETWFEAEVNFSTSYLASSIISKGLLHPLICLIQS